MNLAVVGGGIMGLSVAWAGLRGGHQVDLFEQAEVPNPLGSSVDQHRLIRFPYGANEGYCHMVAGAFAAWDRLWADLGEVYYAETGTLALSFAPGDWAEQSRRVLDRLSIPYGHLSPESLRRHYPFLTTAGVRGAYRLATGGTLFASAIVAALARHVEARGVRLHTRRAVRDVDPGRARLTLADATHQDADALVIAAGPWAPRLVPSLRGRVVPSRQVYLYTTPPPEHAGAWAAAPMILDIGPGSGFYAVPPVAGRDLKFGWHAPSLTGNPDDDREARAEEVNTLFASCRDRFSDFAGYRLIDAKTCFYSIAEGERFIVEPQERAWVLAGFSGHGFKFAPLIGEAVVAALDGRRDPARVSDWAAGIPAR